MNRYQRRKGSGCNPRPWILKNGVDMVTQGPDDPMCCPTQRVVKTYALESDQLVETGAQSIEDALRVGAAIEEIDILDLEAHMAETDREDILRVYGNLLSGSENHLRAFVGNLERRVQSAYVPQYLDQDAYEAILGAGQGRGNGRG